MLHVISFESKGGYHACSWWGGLFGGILNKMAISVSFFLVVRKGDGHRTPSAMAGYTFQVRESVKTASSTCRAARRQRDTAVPSVAHEASAHTQPQYKISGDFFYFSSS